jgi:uncharacterized protein YlxW (UPF0749 family)
MIKTLVLSFVAFWLVTLSPRCMAQEVLALIRLSTDEAAKASQLAQSVKGAEDRNNRASILWRNFYQSYQAEHPELFRLRFSSDFRVAFGVKAADSLVYEATIVELSAEERQKAESLHREMLEAQEALPQAQQNWRDYQYELVAGHIPSTGPGVTVVLTNGRSVTIPIPWSNGLAFTPAFRISVPRN